MIQNIYYIIVGVNSKDKNDSSNIFIREIRSHNDNNLLENINYDINE